MRYLLLLYGDAAAEAALDDGERRAIVDAHMALVARLAERGALVAAEALAGGERARTVRPRASGRPLVRDGPFAETKEQLGGIFEIECDSLDEAIEAASRVPVARRGSVEIRPLVE
jgi:hypothetical protein